MATPEQVPNKTDFLRDLFRKNPGINEKEAALTWKQAGYDGSISASLFYTTKAALNKPSAPVTVTESESRVPAPKKSSPKKAEPAPTPKDRDRPKKPRDDDRERMLANIEGDIDRVIFKLMVLGGMERVEETLRSARRAVTRSHEA